MGTASWVATFLDTQMLAQAGVVIASASTPTAGLPARPGQDVSIELGHRYLVRYMLASQVGQYRQGSAAQHYVTPTAYSPEETIPYLALPSPTQPRPYALLLDASQIPVISGPQWVLGGPGIQYLLPHGFPRSAIVVPGGGAGGWEIQVR